MTVRAITCEEEFNGALEKAKDTLVLVDFYATWCGPCKMIAPKLMKMAEEYGEKLVVLKVDVDEAEELAATQEIVSMPTFKFFKNTKLIDTIIGASVDKIKEAIARNL